MALISCPECRREVSDRAPACPHCGWPIAESGRPGAQSGKGAPPVVFAARCYKCGCSIPEGQVHPRRVKTGHQHTSKPGWFGPKYEYSAQYSVVDLCPRCSEWQSTLNAVKAIFVIAV